MCPDSQVDGISFMSLPPPCRGVPLPLVVTGFQVEDAHQDGRKVHVSPFNPGIHDTFYSPLLGSLVPAPATLHSSMGYSQQGS